MNNASSHASSFTYSAFHPSNWAESSNAITAKRSKCLNLNRNVLCNRIYSIIYNIVASFNSLIS